MDLDIKKLKQLESSFLSIYPDGFQHPQLKEIGKKMKSEQMFLLAEESFTKEKFEEPSELVKAMVKIITRSPLISLFEKPKLRDYVESLSKKDKETLSNGLYEFFYGKEELGFNLQLDVLHKGKLAKWSIMTVCPTYFRPKKEIFVKPTTTKDILAYFQIPDLEYKPTPSYEFYKKYRTWINKMKTHADSSLSPSNAAFSGFLMMSLGKK
ncbi:hypothetical protein [Leptospira ilyithenensis]|uniref:Uncharacterized protein n=1 Tax=Leptospira ilyithenensis TaxID=2484901 RepID=A0A4R9LR96_9LEPT|nr:hypothetical protein [Leptospira ilyithenensis]TGN13202.1 hypothetical protein EHS11_04720 [Leptospira ilyithenensis]